MSKIFLSHIVRHIKDKDKICWAIRKQKQEYSLFYWDDDPREKNENQWNAFAQVENNVNVLGSGLYPDMPKYNRIIMIRSR